MNEPEFDGLCRLARLALSGEEKARLREQMEGILACVEALRKVDVAGAEPMGHASGIPCPLREDAPGRSLPADEALSQSPKRAWNFFSVPQVMED